MQAEAVRLLVQVGNDELVNSILLIVNAKVIDRGLIIPFWVRRPKQKAIQRASVTDRGLEPRTN
jgi:hypothetical protein